MPRPATRQYSMPSSLKVLIVDDNATNREILEAYVASVAGVRARERRLRRRGPAGHAHRGPRR